MFRSRVSSTATLLYKCLSPELFFYHPKGKVCPIKQKLHSLLPAAHVCLWIWLFQILQLRAVDLLHVAWCLHSCCTMCQNWLLFFFEDWFTYFWLCRVFIVVWAFLQLWIAGVGVRRYSGCPATPFHCSGLSYRRAWDLGPAGFSSCSMWAQ